MNMDRSVSEQKLDAFVRELIHEHDRINQQALTTLSNLMNKSIMNSWTCKNKLNLVLIDPVGKNSEHSYEFIVPEFSREFVKEFLNGERSISEYMLLNPTISIGISRSVLVNCTDPSSFIESLRTHVMYYIDGIDVIGARVAAMLCGIGMVGRDILWSTDLYLIVELILRVLLASDVVGIDNDTLDGPRVSIIDDMVGLFCEILNNHNCKDETKKSKLINECTKLVNVVCDSFCANEGISRLRRIPTIVAGLYGGHYTQHAVQIAESIRFEQCEPEMIFTEKKKTVRKLKKFPADLIAYITIEGEAIRDANDKMMIVSYAYGKLELLDFYIQILEASGGTGEFANIIYIVPHSKAYLDGMKTQLLAAIKKIMSVRVPTPSDPLFDINAMYPVGYQG